MNTNSGGNINLLLLLTLFILIPSVVKILGVKSSKKLKSKAGVATHLNRPGTFGQQKSLEIEQSYYYYYYY